MVKVIAIKTPPGYKGSKGALYFKCVNDEGEEIQKPRALLDYFFVKNPQFETDYPGYWDDQALYELYLENGRLRKGVDVADAYFAILTDSTSLPEPDIKDFPLQAFLDRVNALLA